MGDSRSNVRDSPSPSGNNSASDSLHRLGDEDLVSLPGEQPNIPSSISVESGNVASTTPNPRVGLLEDPFDVGPPTPGDSDSASVHSHDPSYNHTLITVAHSQIVFPSGVDSLFLLLGPVKDNDKNLVFIDQLLDEFVQSNVFQREDIKSFRRGQNTLILVRFPANHIDQAHFFSKTLEKNRVERLFTLILYPLDGHIIYNVIKMAVGTRFYSWLNSLNLYGFEVQLVDDRDEQQAIINSVSSNNKNTKNNEKEQKPKTTEKSDKKSKNEANKASGNKNMGPTPSIEKLRVVVDDEDSDLTTSSDKSQLSDPFSSIPIKSVALAKKLEPNPNLYITKYYITQAQQMWWLTHHAEHPISNPLHPTKPSDHIRINHPHPLSALERRLSENICLSKLSKSQLICDIGGNPIRHTKRRPEFGFNNTQMLVHCCCPQLSYNDVGRHHKYQEQEAKNYCFHKVSECHCYNKYDNRQQFDAYISIHSLYYLTPDEVVNLVYNCTNQVLIAAVHQFDQIKATLYNGESQYCSTLELTNGTIQRVITMFAKGNNCQYQHSSIEWLTDNDHYTSTYGRTITWRYEQYGETAIYTIIPAPGGLISEAKSSIVKHMVLENGTKQANGHLNDSRSWRKMEDGDLHNVKDEAVLCRTYLWHQLTVFQTNEIIAVPSTIIDTVSLALTMMERNEATMRYAVVRTKQELGSLNMSPHDKAKSAPLIASLAFMQNLEHETDANNTIVNSKYSSIQQHSNSLKISPIGPLSVLSSMFSSCLSHMNHSSVVVMTRAKKIFVETINSPSNMLFTAITINCLLLTFLSVFEALATHIFQHTVLGFLPFGLFCMIVSYECSAIYKETQSIVNLLIHLFIHSLFYLMPFGFSCYIHIFYNIAVTSYNHIFTPKYTTGTIRFHIANLTSYLKRDPVLLDTDPVKMNICYRNVGLAKLRQGAEVRVETMKPCSAQPATIHLGPASFYSRPIVSRSCVHNDVNAVVNRIAFDLTYDKKEWANMTEVLLHDNEIWDYMFPSKENKIGDKFYSWIKQRPYSSRIKFELIQVYEHHRELERTDYYSRAFTKIESIIKEIEDMGSTDVLTRLIQGTSKLHLILTGPFIHELTGLLKEKWHKDSPIFYSAGSNNRNLGEWADRAEALMDECIGKFVIMLEDFTNYDGSQTEESKKFKRDFYKVFCLVTDVIRLFSFTKTKGSTKHGVHYKCNGSHGSGHSDTSTGNSLLHICINIYILLKAGLTIHEVFARILLMVLGDDGASVIPREWKEHYTPEAYAKFGLTAKIQFVNHISEADYCSGLFYYTNEGRVWGPKIGRHLSKSTYRTLTDTSSIMTNQEWVDATDTAYYYMCHFVPVLRGLYPAPVANSLPIAKGTRVINTSLYGYNERSLMEMCSRYNVMPNELIELEQLLAKYRHQPVFLTSPLIKIICDVDCPITKQPAEIHNLTREEYSPRDFDKNIIREPTYIPKYNKLLKQVNANKRQVAVNTYLELFDIEPNPGDFDLVITNPHKYKFHPSFNSREPPDTMSDAQKESATIKIINNQPGQRAKRNNKPKRDNRPFDEAQLKQRIKVLEQRSKRANRPNQTPRRLRNTVNQNEREIRNIINKILTGISLPAFVREFRYSSGTERTCVHNSQQTPDCVWTNDPTATGSRYYLDPSDNFACVFADPRRSAVMYDPNKSASTYEYQFMYEGTNTQTGPVDHFQINSNEWPRVIYAKNVSSGTYAPHGARLWAGEDDQGNSMVWCDAGGTVTFSGLGASTSYGFEAIANVRGETFEQQTVTATTNGAGEYVYAIPFSGYWNFSVGTADGIVIGSVSVKYSANGATFRHLEIQDFSVEFQSIQQHRVLSASLMYSNRASEGYSSGNITIAQLGGNMDWMSVCGLNTLTTYPLAPGLTQQFLRSLPASQYNNTTTLQGAYAFIKPQDIKNEWAFQLTTENSSVGAINPSVEPDVTPFLLNDKRPYLACAVHQNPTTSSVQEGIWTFAHATEAITTSSWKATNFCNIDPNIFDSAIFELRTVPQFHENPSHFSDIIDFARTKIFPMARDVLGGLSAVVPPQFRPFTMGGSVVAGLLSKDEKKNPPKRMGRRR